MRNPYTIYFHMSIYNSGIHTKIEDKCLRIYDVVWRKFTNISQDPPIFIFSYTLKMEEECSFETFIYIYQTTCHIPEDSNLIFAFTATTASNLVTKEEPTYGIYPHVGG
jgi:hypothetical protein